MCLIKLEDKPRIADEPILVYKVLNYRNGKYYSPFEEYEYHQGLNSPDMTAKYYINVEEITGGYLHAYIDVRMAIVNRNSLAHSDLSQRHCNGYRGDRCLYQVVKMYIPEGTEYWIGRDEDIAAKKLYWPEENNDQ